MSIHLLNVRAPDNSVARSVEASSTPLSSRVIFLIHGYNNDSSAAEASYKAFTDHTGLGNDSKAVCEVFWPGDKHWGPVSFGSYPLEIGPAVTTAERLEEYIANLQVPGVWPLQVVLICHSLGNRVGFEIIERYRSQARPNIEFTFCSMAAAVPSSFVQMGGALFRTAQTVKSYVVMYSRGDTVLSAGFPIGETLALEGFFPQAIGSRGNPMHLWRTASCREMSSDGSKYSHGSYWPGAESAELARDFVNGMPLPSISPRLTPNAKSSQRSTPSSTLRSRETPKGRSL